MNIRRATHYVCLLSIPVLITTACQEERLESMAASDGDNQKVSFNKHSNYLEFKTSEAFEATLKHLETQQATSSDVLAQFSEFSSMNDVFEKAIREDKKYFEEMETLYERGEVTLEEVQGTHSRYTEANFDYFLFDNDGSYYMNSFHPNIAKLVNKEGIVKVGDTLRRYTRHQVSFLPGGEANEIETLVQAKDSDTRSGLLVTPVDIQGEEEGGLMAYQDYLSYEGSPNTRVSGQYTDQHTKYGSVGCRRRRLTLRVTIAAYSNGFVYDRSVFSVYVKHELKGLFGWNTNIERDGEIRVGVGGSAVCALENLQDAAPLSLPDLERLEPFLFLSCDELSASSPGYSGHTPVLNKVNGIEVGWYDYSDKRRFSFEPEEPNPTISTVFYDGPLAGFRDIEVTAKANDSYSPVCQDDYAFCYIDISN